MNGTPVNDAAAVISALPARAARLLAAGILLAEFTDRSIRIIALTCWYS